MSLLVFFHKETWSSNQSSSRHNRPVLAGSRVDCGRRVLRRHLNGGRTRVPLRGGAVGRSRLLRRVFLVVLLGIKFGEPLHALLHAAEFVDALGALHLLFAVVEARERLFELGSTRPTGHAAETRTVPVYPPVRKDQAFRKQRRAFFNIPYQQHSRPQRKTSCYLHLNISDRNPNEKTYW